MACSPGASGSASQRRAGQRRRQLGDQLLLPPHVMVRLLMVGLPVRNSGAAVSRSRMGEREGTSIQAGEGAAAAGEVGARSELASLGYRMPWQL